MIQLGANNSITLTRGDSAYIDLSILDWYNNEYIPRADDVIVFTVKSSASAFSPLIQKECKGMKLVLKPEDTKFLAYGTYWYDIQLKTITGDVFTVIAHSRFTVSEEMTW